jgi:hypothetical protein
MKQSLHSLLWKCFFLLTLLFALNLTSFGQLSSGTNFEGGITVGPMGFLGDLGGNVGRGTSFVKDYNFKTTKLSGGAYIAAYPAEWLGLRFAINFGGIEGNDAYTNTKGGEEVSRKNRNLDFRSNILEAFVAGEIYPTVFLENDPTDVQGRLRPYGLIGIGVFHFNPQGTYNNPVTHQAEWVDLRPLHTEGEGFPEYPDRKEYALTQLNIPMGVGVKYYFSNNVNVSFEIVHRKTFTDYLDDVSTTFVDPSVFSAHLTPAQAAIASAMSNKSPLRDQHVGYDPGSKRGDPTQNDAYFTMGFKLGIRLNTGNEWRNSTRCPILRF